MAHLKQTNRRRSSSLCHLHLSAKPTSGLCASCLRKRLASIEAQSQAPELRRIRSHFVRNPSSAFISEQPRRRSCDVRPRATSLHDLFVDDDERQVDYYHGEHKTMKEFIDLDWGRKNNGKGFSRKLLNFSLTKRKDEISGLRNVIGRHSCDVDPRLFEASWDGCLIEKTYHKLTSSMSIKRHGLLEVDEFKPETVGLFHGAKLLLTEKELRDSNWYSIKNHKPETKGLGSVGKICISAREGNQNGAEVKKPKKKWPKVWNIWALIQRKNDIKTEQSLKLEGNAIEGSLAESLLKLRRVSKGETNGGVSEKLLKSYSVSSRKSCDGMLSGPNLVTGFEGGRSSCDGLFHGSINSVEVGRGSCDGLVNGIDDKQNHHLHQRKTNDGTYTRENLVNSLFSLL